MLYTAPIMHLDIGVYVECSLGTAWCKQFLLGTWITNSTCIIKLKWEKQLYVCTHKAAKPQQDSQSISGVVVCTLSEWWASFVFNDFS